jgi:hypothetical protein
MVTEWSRPNTRSYECRAAHLGRSNHGEEFGSIMPTDRDWVLDVVTGYNTDIDTCTITKGSTNKISAGQSLELHRAQKARAQSAERRAQRPHKALQRQSLVGEARRRSQTCVARSICKAKRSHRVSARKEAAQVRTTRTFPWRKRLVHEDEIARRSPAEMLRQQSKERRQSTSVTTAEKVARGEARSHLAERHARMYR